MEFDISVYCDYRSGREQDQVSQILESAKEEISVSFSLPNCREGDYIHGVTRFVRIQPDGTVIVEDVPQAIGMTSDEISFVCPSGKRLVSLPPGRITKKGRGRYLAPSPKVD